MTVKIVPQDAKEVEEPPADLERPEKLVFRVIDIKLRSSGTIQNPERIGFDYTHTEVINLKNEPGNTHEERRKSALTRIAARGFPSSHTPPTIDGNVRSNMSARNADDAYLVFKLSETKDWQFMPGEPPIMIQEDHTEDCYYEARNVLPDGKIAAPKGASDGCMCAYLIGLGNKARRQTGDSYSDSINFLVDLVETRQGGNVDRKVPIIIDPDVGYPGGSGND